MKKYRFPEEDLDKASNVDRSGEPHDARKSTGVPDPGTIYSAALSYRTGAARIWGVVLHKAEQGRG